MTSHPTDPAAPPLRRVARRLQALESAARRNRRPFLFGAAIVFGWLLVLRHPHGLLDATFWAEDGWVWYPDAYRLGLSSLLLPHSGYLQTFSRMIAIAAQPFPLLWAPTIFAVAAFLVRIVPPLLLLSHKFDEPWPSLPARLFFATLYIALPNSVEEFANVTNAQWHLALVAFLLVTATPPKTTLGRITNLVTLAICGLSGPFCVFLLPIAAWSWFQSPTPQRRDQLLCITLCALVQGTILILTATQTRAYASLGADPIAFARILANQIQLGLIFGATISARLAHTSILQSNHAVLLVAGLGLATGAAALWRGPAVFRQFALFGALMLAASLTNPVLTLDEPAWTILARPGAGQRYFLVPMLVAAGACIVLAADKRPALRCIGIALCLAMLIGITGDWRYPRMQVTNFNSLARQFAAAPAGTRMAFPLHPPGAAPMILVKR